MRARAASLAAGSGRAKAVRPALLLLAVPALLAAGCAGTAGDARGHEFEVDGGFGAHSAVLVLNDVETGMTEARRNVFVARREIGDASGHIRVVYDGEGAETYCRIGHVASGQAGPHRYVVERGVCRER